MTDIGDLRAERVDAIRHELRAPIDHIVGYGELLLDEARESRLTALGPDVRRIVAAGRELLALCESALEPESIRDDRDVEALGQLLRTPLNSILGYAELLQEEATVAGRPDVLRDLARIHDAATRLEDPVGALLDLVRTEFTARAQAEAPLPGSSERGEGTVLVAADGEADRELLSRALERAGHRIVGADCGEAALRAVSAGGVDLVLLDLRAAEIEAYEVCRRIRDDPATGFLPVLITAASEQEKRRAVAAGADDLIAKPVDQAELFVRVRSLLRIKRYHDTIERQRGELAARER